MNTPLTKGEKTKARIIDSFVRIVGRDGMSCATIRSIAREAEVTEGLIYRYFENKEAMIQEIWGNFMSEMLETKRTLVENCSNPHELFRNWIEVSYEAYDKNPYIFSLLFFDHLQSLVEQNEQLIHEMICLFSQFIDKTAKQGQLAVSDTNLAVKIFAAMQLSIPWEIHQNSMEGPAGNYVEIMTKLTTNALLRH